MALPGLPKRLTCGSTPLASVRMGQPVSVCQYLSIPGTCSASLIHCAVGASSGSPASHRALRLLTLYLPNHCGSCFLSTRSAVGAENMCVTRYFSTMLHHTPPSGPTPQPIALGVKKPPAGAAPSSATEKICFMLAASATVYPPVSRCTPLGRPVVPLVYNEYLASYFSTNSQY